MPPGPMAQGGIVVIARRSLALTCWLGLGRPEAPQPRVPKSVAFAEHCGCLPSALVRAAFLLARSCFARFQELRQIGVRYSPALADVDGT